MQTSQILIDEQFLPKAINIVLNAQKSIDISTFKAEINSKPRGRKLLTFFYALLKQAKAGVEIRFLLNKTVPKGHIPISNNYAIAWMKNSKIKIRCLQNDRICHAKMIIVDNEKAIFGSHNLSVRSCHNNFEVSCCTTDYFSIAFLTKAFEAVWENSQTA